MYNRKLFVIAYLIFFIAGCNSSHNYEIAYKTSDYEKISPNYYSYYDLMIMDSDGQNNRKLLNWGTMDKSFVWMPDGESVLFMDIENDQYFIGKIGEDTSTICVTCAFEYYFEYPLPSPLGNEIAIVSSDQVIVIFEVESQTLRQVPDQNFSSYNKSWSPDGKMIAISHESDIFIIDINTGITINLTSGIEGTGERSLSKYFPQWSPIGGEIAFNTNYHLAVINIDGSNYREISVIHTSNQYGKTGRVSQWSPNGKKLVFVSNNVDSNDPDANLEIYVVDVATGEKFQLTNTPGFDNESPVWSPDGKQIAFVSERNGKKDIFVMDADGGNQINLTNSPDTRDYNPQWRP